MKEEEKCYDDFYTLECDITRILSLATTIYQGYFEDSIERARELTYAKIECDYERTSDLLSICLGLILDLQKTLSNVQRKYEDVDEDEVNNFVMAYSKLSPKKRKAVEAFLDCLEDPLCPFNKKSTGEEN